MKLNVKRILKWAAIAIATVTGIYVSIIVFFFVLTIVTLNEPVVDLTPPVTREFSDKSPLVITIAKNGDMSLQDQAVSRENVLEQLSAAAEGDFKISVMIVCYDAQICQTMIAFKRTVENEGFVNVSMISPLRSD